MSYSRNDRLQRVEKRHLRINLNDQLFKCIQCQQYVVCAPLVAGVQNRNHCPACLWSRHLDDQQAGDRRSNCRAAMEPLGLTTKRSRNKYARERDGELMVIHRCTGCAKLVLNRIAADDSAAAILELINNQRRINAALQAELATSGVLILASDDHQLVWRRLFGDRSPSDETGSIWQPDPLLADQ